MAQILISSNPKSISPEIYRGMFCNFILEYALDGIKSLLLKIAGPEEHFGVTISALDLIHFDPALAFTTLHFPSLLLPIFDDAIYETQTLLLSQNLFAEKMTIKPHCHTRLINLPPTSEFSKNSIRQLHSYEIDKLIQITGIVTRTSSVRMLKVSKEYECQNPKCMYRFRVYADAERGHVLPQPRQCPSSLQQNDVSDREGKKKPCNSTNLREIEGSAQCIDYQEIKIQDQMERLPAGYAPLSLLVSVEADLVDKIRVGEEVRVVGTIVRRWGGLYEKVRCQVHLYLAANSIVPHYSASQSSSLDRREYFSSLFHSYWENYHKVDPSTQENGKDSHFSLRGRDTIVRAVCPNLHGMFYVKLSLLLTLIGGSRTSSEQGGTRRRSQSHLLIVGDPGTGKSQLLRFASTLLPCSVLTTGVGTTGAGLTCSAVRESNSDGNSGGWAIEAGALVLANNGVCCIDEFSSIKEADRATIHEAMEQQTLSVAKAGMVVTLHTRCSVVAVCNPKGGYDVANDITTNTAIAGPLLSRFDLVLVLMDRPNKDWDKRISTYLLKQAIGEGNQPVTSMERKNFQKNTHKEENTWDKETLRKYVLLIRNTRQPIMTEPARCILVRYYQLQRLKDDRSSSRTTVRLFESSLRLAEAHAKLMYRNLVLIQDAIIAISCMELSSFDGGHAPSSSQSALHSDFPLDPDEEYQRLEERILRSMQYSREIVFREIATRKHQQEEDYPREDDDILGLAPSAVSSSIRPPQERGIISLSSLPESHQHLEFPPLLPIPATNSPQPQRAMKKGIESSSDLIARPSKKLKISASILEESDEENECPVLASVAQYQSRSTVVPHTTLFGDLEETELLREEKSKVNTERVNDLRDRIITTERQRENDPHRDTNLFSRALVGLQTSLLTEETEQPSESLIRSLLEDDSETW